MANPRLPSPRPGGLLRWCFVLGVLALLAARAQAEVPIPTLTGPITGPGVPFLQSTAFALEPFGYVQEEYFVSGTATAFTSAGPLSNDGKWTVTPSGTSADYTTRILVRRPAAQRRFNGTVVVEWLNVSGGLDAAPDWTFAHTELLREGFAWVGVSAQLQGVSGAGGILGLNLTLKAVNPTRYAPLLHPGDSFSYDMFSQVAQALRHPGNSLVLAGLRPKRWLAIGESQSAFRLVTYIDAVHPTARVYDGFLVHSRSGNGAALSQSPLPTITVPTPALIRDDLDVPVLTLETETDLISLGFFAARQADGPGFRLWEMAGTAHDDTYGLLVGPGDQGRGAIDTTYVPPTAALYGGIITCGSPINTGPQHYVVNAALARLDRWVRSGREPATADRLDVVAGSPPVIQRDARGNALGGIRTAQVDVPVARLSGLGQTGSSFCSLFGTTQPFDAPTLATLYPKHRDYVRAVARATTSAVRKGFLLPIDARAIRTAAAASSIGE